ncbi:MAG TPA: sialidase family protein [Actinomycetota bacterium]|jgi:hypothetical protein
MHVLKPWSGIVPFILLIGLLAAVEPAASAPPPRLSVSPNVNVSRMAGNQAETTIAVNPTNPNNIAVASNVQFGAKLFKAYSTDGGRSWTTDLIADGDNLGVACCDPSMAFDEFGNLFLTYLDSKAHLVMMALSTDGGANFSFLGSIRSLSKSADEHPPGSKTKAPVDQPTVTTGAGTVWVDWKVFNGSHTSIEASGARVSGLGQVGAFSAPQRAPGSAEGNFGDVAIGPKGQVMVVYQDNIPTEGPSNIWVNVDPDGLGPQGFGSQIAVGTTNVGGFDFIPPQSRRSVDAETGLAWDRSGGQRTGRVYLLYTDELPDESNDTDNFVRFSNDDGHSWSTPVRVNDDAGHNSQFNPRIALDQTSGNVAVSWHDSRNDLGTGGPGDTNGVPNDDAQFFATASVDGGLSFLPNVQVSEGTSNAIAAANGVQYGDYTGLTFHAGRFYPSWADNSNSTGDNPDGALSKFDVYTARISLS